MCSLAICKASPSCYAPCPSNRKLRLLVALELKVGEFKVAYKGQMELHLRWLDKFERVALGRGNVDVFPP
jgi:hypothetical protein